MSSAQSGRGSSSSSRSGRRSRQSAEVVIRDTEQIAAWNDQASPQSHSVLNTARSYTDDIGSDDTDPLVRYSPSKAFVNTLCRFQARLEAMSRGYIKSPATADSVPIKYASITEDVTGDAEIRACERNTVDRLARSINATWDLTRSIHGLNAVPFEEALARKAALMQEHWPRWERGLTSGASDVPIKDTSRYQLYRTLQNLRHTPNAQQACSDALIIQINAFKDTGDWGLFGGWLQGEVSALNDEKMALEGEIMRAGKKEAANEDLTREQKDRLDRAKLHLKDTMTLYHHATRAVLDLGAKSSLAGVYDEDQFRAIGASVGAEASGAEASGAEASGAEASVQQ